MKIIKSIIHYITTRYTKVQLIVIAVVILFGFVLSDSSLYSRFFIYDTEIRQLENQIEEYREQAKQDKEQLEQLNSNKDDIEKFARERYLMKRENEDIYIVE